MSFNIELRDLNNCFLEDNKTIITTITNYGYLLYTLNMLKSLKQFNLDKKVLVVCIDNKSADVLRRLQYNVVCIGNLELSKMSAWNTPGYDKICYLKLEVIYKVLSLGANIVLVDGDIVFLKNPLNDINWWLQETAIDIHIQNDSLENTNTTNMCTGYMLIKSNNKTITLYDCISEEGLKKYRECAFDNNDQTYFNKFVKPYCTFKSISLMNYPNGQLFYNEPVRKHNAVLVHFNWIKGHLKMAKIKEHKMWLLTPEEEELL